jgi:hypothetical protein
VASAVSATARLTDWGPRMLASSRNRFMPIIVRADGLFDNVL